MLIESLLLLAALTSLMAWLAGHVERVSERQDPPRWVRIIEFPVYFVTTILSVATNLIIGWIWGPPNKDTFTLTKRLEEVLSNPDKYKEWQMKIAKGLAWWVNKLWIGHIKNA